MPEQNTRPDTGDVDEFLAQVDDPAKRADSYRLIELMSAVSGEPPVLWGSMVGFGRYHYKYTSGHEGDAFLVGFAPRKAEFSIYLMGTYLPEEIARRDALLAKLGRHRMGKACLCEAAERYRPGCAAGTGREFGGGPACSLSGKIKGCDSISAIAALGMPAVRTVEGLGDKRPAQHSLLTGCMGRLPCQ